MKLRHACFTLLLCSLFTFSACSNNPTDPAESTVLTNKSEMSLVWNTLYYEDEFGDVTDFAYISTSIEGTTRKPNSSSDKDAQVVIEYHFLGSHYFAMSAPLPSVGVKEELRGPATIKLKIDDEVYTKRLRVPSGYDICIEANDEDTESVYHMIYNALISGKDVKVHFEDYDHKEYIFIIESGNFMAAIESAILELA